MTLKIDLTRFSNLSIDPQDDGVWVVTLNRPTKRNAQFHWPEGTPPPLVTGLQSLPVITSGGAKLTNEA